MNFSKYLIHLSVIGALLGANAYSLESNYERRHDQTDDRSIRGFVQSKENIEIKEKASHLEISGDVRAEWNHDLEHGFRTIFKNGKFKQKYVLLQGKNGLDDDLELTGSNDWDIEFNLKIKYAYERSWAMAQLQFDNPSGTNGYNFCDDAVLVLDEDGSSLSSSSYSGQSSPSGVAIARDNSSACKGSGAALFINLKRAYMGYNIWADGNHRLDVEVGRQKLNDLFESEIQYSSRFDGIVFKFASRIDEVFDWYCYASAFVIDERVNHIGYAGEIGLLNAFDSNIDIKYSFIDWKNQGKNRCFVHHSVGAAFMNSQIFMEYHIDPSIGGKTVPASFYGAFVYNHAAPRTSLTHGKRQNIGWYAGFFIGEAKKKGEWNIDIMYQYVEAQMASDCDVDGIGRGNILNEHFTDVLIFDESLSSSSIDSIDSGFSSSEISKFSSQEVFLPRRGNANFKGWTFEGLYAFTDHLAVDITFEFTHAADSHIGGAHHFRHFEIEALYTF